jgi:hypothetical protein
MLIMRLPKLIEQANLINQEALPGTPGIVVYVQLHHDRDRGWWEVTVRETIGEHRQTQRRYEYEDEAREALDRVFALYEGVGMWKVKQYG